MTFIHISYNKIMFAQLNTIDLQLTRSISQLFPHNYLLNIFFSFFSLTGASFFVWIIIILGIIVIEEIIHPGIQKRDIKFVIFFLMTFLITYIASDLVLKNIFHRPRPFFVSNQYSGVCPKDFSFPSTHAATALASASILAFFDKKRKWFYYSIATLIGFSRIYLYCHYFFDVIIGGILGLFISKIFTKITLKLTPK